MGEVLCIFLFIQIFFFSLFPEAAEVSKLFLMTDYSMNSLFKKLNVWNSSWKSGLPSSLNLSFAEYPLNCLIMVCFLLFVRHHFLFFSPYFEEQYGLLSLQLLPTITRKRLLCLCKGSGYEVSTQSQWGSYLWQDTGLTV